MRAAAFLAADLGLEVTLIDPEVNPGGVCLYRGCIPSKALLHAAKVIHEAAEAERFGVSYQKPEIDLDKLRAGKDKVVKRLTGGLGQLAKQRKVQVVTGVGFLIIGLLKTYVTRTSRWKGILETLLLGAIAAAVDLGVVNEMTDERDPCTFERLQQLRLVIRQLTKFLERVADLRRSALRLPGCGRSESGDPHELAVL